MIKIEQISAEISIGWLDMAQYRQIYKNLTKRELEKNGAALVLKNLFNGDVYIENDEFNKPHLVNRPEFVSISHSHNWLVVAINKKEEIGVDIEMVKDTVNKIKTKFLCDEELIFAQEDLRKLTTFWAAKESIYKAYGKKSVDFKNQIRVSNFDVANKNTFTGSLTLKDDVKWFELILVEIEDYVLTLVTKEIHA